MDVDVKFPSPTPFLARSPVVDAAPPPISATRKTAKHASGPSKKVAVKTHTVQDGVVAKPKQSKSRNGMSDGLAVQHSLLISAATCDSALSAIGTNHCCRIGCITCKKKRLKCDETKPGCLQCQKRSVTCEGYKKDFKWRSFEEAMFTTKPATKARKGKFDKLLKLSTALLTVPASASFPSTSRTPLPTEPPQASPSHHSGSSQNADDDFRNHFLSPIDIDQSDSYHFMPRSQTTPDASPPFTSMPIEQPMYTPIDDSNLFYVQQLRDSFNDHSLPEAHLTQAISDFPMSEVQTSRFPTKSPQLVNILLPGTDLNQRSDPAEPRPAQSPLPYQPNGLSESLNTNNMFIEDFDEEIPRDMSRNTTAASQTISNSWSLRPDSPVASDSSSSSDSSDLVMYSQPRLKPTSPEMLLHHFDHHTCGILSVKDGPSENPWRTLVWPLAQDSPALAHAIYSMSALHGSKGNRELTMGGVDHARKSMKELVANLNNMHFDAGLATTLALAFSESWDEHSKSGISHLRGARGFVSNAVTNHKALTRAGISDARRTERLKFLCNTYIYMDVLARLTSLEETDHDVDHGYFENIMSEVNGPLDMLNEVDPLLGCAYTLFPLIGRVANLVQKVRKTDTNSITLVSHATELKQLVQQWAGPDAMLFERPEDPTSEVEHFIQTAEAYRWATLLFLHQAVPEVPSEPTLALAKRVLLFLARVPLSSRATIVQIFPLLAASCEVVDEDDRTLVRKRWKAMIERLQIRNVHKCLEVVEEVWRRRDEFESEKAELAWRRQAFRNGSSTTSGASPMIGPGKRKATTLDVMENDPFFHGYSGPENAQSSSNGPNVKRRLTVDYMGRPVSLSTMPVEARLPPQMAFTRRPSDLPMQTIDHEYTVRGRLHWLGVMKDNNWEGMIHPPCFFR
jgi:hypothetical protein